MVDYTGRPGSSSAMPAEPIYQHIRTDLRRRIEAGEWPPGTQIPTQRELAEQYGASLQPVKAALMYLEEVDRLIVSRQGKGVFVAEQ